MRSQALRDSLVRFAFDFARRVTGHDADAEDLAQEALLELAEARPTHVPERAFVGRRIVLLAKMLRRANLTRARHERAAARGVEVPAEEGASAREALELLGPEDRHAVELRFLHGLSYAEVAHVLGVSEPSARMRVHRALQSLRERLGPRAESMVAALPLFAVPRLFPGQIARVAALSGGGIAVKKISVLIVILVVAGGIVASRAMRAERPARAERPVLASAEPSPLAQAEQPPADEAGAPAGDAPSTPLRVLVGRIAFEDGEPLRRARIRLIDTKVTGETDDDGGFRIEGEVVAGARLGLDQKKYGYVAIARAELSAAEPLRLDVALKRGTLLEGVVMKAGSAVPGANLMLERPGAQASGVVQGSFGVCRTDEAGRFLFPHLPDGLYTILVSRHGIEPRHVDVKVEPGLPPKVITVNDARPLTIRIVPVSRAWQERRMVRIESVERESAIRLIHFLAPDERGEMVVAEAPPPGRYVLVGLPGGYREFDVAESGALEVVVDLSRFGRVVGRVTSPCDVRIGSSRAHAGADGTYEVDLVAPGEHQVEIWIGKSVLYRPPVRVPESVEVRLDHDLRGVTVRGRLQHDGDPRSSSVSLGRRGRKEGLFAVGYVDDDSRFSIPFVEPGNYEIRGHTSGDRQGGRREITVGSQDVDVGDVVIEPYSEVAVIVTAPAGTRLPGRHDLHAWDGRREHLHVPLLLDDGGRGTAQLPAGRWRLSLVIGDLPQGNAEVDVPAREPVRFDLAR